jgi:hypothetical protein
MDAWQYVLLQLFRSFPRRKKIVRLLRPKKIAPTIWGQTLPTTPHRLPIPCDCVTRSLDPSTPSSWALMPSPTIEGMDAAGPCPWPGRRHLVGTPLRRSEGQTSHRSSLPGHNLKHQKGEEIRRRWSNAAEERLRSRDRDLVGRGPRWPCCRRSRRRRASS